MRDSDAKKGQAFRQTKSQLATQEAQTQRYLFWKAGMQLGSKKASRPPENLKYVYYIQKKEKEAKS